MRHPVLRYGAAALCVLGAVYFLLPLSMGVLHIGMLYPAAGLLLAAVWLLFPQLFRRWPRWLRRTVCVVLAAGLLVLGAILTLMGIRAAHHPDGTQPVTVIVLGCQVRPDGTPSRMLRDRIQAAYDYLSVHEEAVCVASGGQNDREPTTGPGASGTRWCPWASTPAASIWRMPLPPRRRIWPFPLRSSGERVCLRRWPSPPTIFTSCGPVYGRRRPGSPPTPLGCASVWMLGPGYWAREAAALLYMGATGAL